MTSFSSDSFYTNSSPFVTQKVTASEQGTRLDKFLVKSMLDLSRNQIIRTIEAGGVQRQSDGKILKEPDYKVRLEEIFQVTIPEPVDAEPKPQPIHLDILFEDTDLLVINKPAGLVVHPGAGNMDHTLVNALLAHCGTSLSGIGGVKRPGIVHRIDKDTSGILVVAKNDFAHVRLTEQFSKHTIERVYQAFVWGMLPEETGRIEGNIGRSDRNRQKMAIVMGKGKPAVTHYKRMAVYGGQTASQIQCVLETGRTHQIRVHLSSIGHPLIGDPVYGKNPKGIPDEIRLFPRQALHAAILGFIHPRTQEKLVFKAPLPEDMQHLLEALKKL